MSNILTIIIKMLYDV